ncbi:hypothetical protein H4582DRAFT_1886951 [Lactarius indigo]|nr:hypothetical protein H4582DRAFT_1886951 [Lactarius indigo]
MELCPLVRFDHLTRISDVLMVCRRQRYHRYRYSLLSSPNFLLPYSLVLTTCSFAMGCHFRCSFPLLHWLANLLICYLRIPLDSYRFHNWRLLSSCESGGLHTSGMCTALLHLMAKVMGALPTNSDSDPEDFPFSPPCTTL